ncbi:PucR family transcriptional regulator [Nocardia inohanensis]|uniref:PucR family transcriptional regulator n=1 Tax=Nocardia inohanensis TaxID=209246 RepID=UPI0014724CFD|nr:PucR family transcriptional regulator [Nocardia inohanensis]
MRDILNAPQLRMHLLRGEAAELDRPVARVCATDMPDPRPFVTPGALVCTGLVWRQVAADSDRYIALLASAGVAGVVAGQALHGRVPDDVTAACEKHGLPLLSAPQSMPFSRIIEHLADQAAESRWRRMQSTADRQRRMLAAVAAGRDIAEILVDIAAEQDISAWLVTATGTVIAGTAPLSDADLDRIVVTAVTAPRLPAVTSGALRVFQVGAGDRRTAWYLVLRPAAPDPEPFGPDLAAVAELYRQRHTDRLHLDWELADRFPAPPSEPPGGRQVAIVCELHSGTSRGSAVVVARTGSYPAAAQQAGGCASSDPASLVVTGCAADGQTAAGLARRVGRLVPDSRTAGGSPTPRSPGRSAGDEPIESAAEFGAAGRGAMPGDSDWAAAELVAMRSMLHDIFPRAESSVDPAGRLVVVVAEDAGSADDRELGGSTAAALRRRLGRIADAFNETRIAIGVSARGASETLDGAIAASTAAAAAARDDDGAVSVLVADIDSAVGLFTAVPGGLQRRFAERVLGPVVEYDRRHGGGLLETLEVFLGCEGSWRLAAERMHLHLNTVRYRMGRVEELTGRDLGRLDDRLDLYLAMRTLGAQTAPV